VGKLHQHLHLHTQITYAIESVFEFIIGDITKIIRKGDTLLKKKSVVQDCTCLEDVC